METKIVWFQFLEEILYLKSLLSFLTQPLNMGDDDDDDDDDDDMAAP
jgi:hypothetical protein